MITFRLIAPHFTVGLGECHDRVHRIVFMITGSLVETALKCKNTLIIRTQSQANAYVLKLVKHKKEVSSRQQRNINFGRLLVGKGGGHLTSGSSI